MEKMASNTIELVQNPYGNYAIQTALEVNILILIIKSFIELVS
jgi:hypothetical protein